VRCPCRVVLCSTLLSIMCLAALQQQAVTNMLAHATNTLVHVRWQQQGLHISHLHTSTSTSSSACRRWSTRSC
jgi:hypothetical protein